MPSLSDAPTSSCCCPLMTAENRVGVEPKSGSPAACCAAGTVHEPSTVRSLARSFTIDGAKPPRLHEGGVPVVTQMLPSEGSTVGDAQIPPPVHVLGTMLAVCRIDPVEASIANSLPWTRG